MRDEDRKQRFDRHDPELNTAAERCVNSLRYGADAVRPAWAWVQSAFKDGARWQHDREHAEPSAADRIEQAFVAGATWHKWQTTGETCSTAEKRGFARAFDAIRTVQGGCK